MSTNDGLVFTAPTKMRDGSMYDYPKGSCHYVQDHYSDSEYGEPVVSFQDDYSVEGGVCEVPLSRIPQLVEWLQAIITQHGDNPT